MLKWLSGKIGRFALNTERPRASDIEKKSELFARLVSGDEKIPANEFLDLYETRTYNFASNTCDIKIMKTIDFEGVCVLHNCTQDLYYVGLGDKVMYKVSRHLRGFGNEKLFQDFSAGVDMRVMMYRLEDYSYKTNAEMKRAVIEAYPDRRYYQYIEGRECLHNEVTFLQVKHSALMCATHTNVSTVGILA